MGSPILTLDGQPALVGSVPDLEEVKKILNQANETKTDE